MDAVRRDKPLLSPEFLGLVDHAFFRCPFASIEDLIAASSSDTDGAGVAESEINAFLNLMAKDHVHPKAAEHLRKGKCTIERYLAIIDLSVVFLALHCRMAHIPSNGKKSWVCWEAAGGR